MSKTESSRSIVETEIQDVAGKRILVTGGTTGIGRAIALQLASHGARVLIFGRHEKELNDALTDLQSVAAEVHGLTADVSHVEGIRRVFEAVDEKLGGIDILVNNAALSAGSVTEDTYEDWRYIVETNLLGYMACCREAYDRMKKGGQIVLIGSMSADVRESGSDIYVATKSGIQGFAEAFRKKVNEEGVRVTLIEPGAVGTDMPESTPEQQRAQIEAEEILKAEDIAACVYYCITQPARCDVVDVKIRPHLQAI